MNENLTKRQIQAQNTYRKIYNIAIELIEKKGFDNITIAEICKEANVSVGSFYNYFESKYEILNEIFKLADEYFSTTVLSNLQEGTTQDKIIKFFEYYGDYNIDRGIDFVKQLYVGKNNLFTTKGRPMQTVLKSIIEEGQKNKEISTDMTSDQIVRFLFITARGIIYDWCLHDGEYDLIATINDYIKRIVYTL